MDGFPWGEVVRVVGTLAVIFVQWWLTRRPPPSTGAKGDGADKTPLRDAAARAVGAGGTIAIMLT